MTLNHYPIDQFKADILNIAKKYFNLSTTKLFVFGSRASGKGDDRSDIDLGIESDPPIDSQNFQNFKDELDNLNTLYTIDTVDFNQVSEIFKKVASENKIYLN
ncbi:MAG: DNA polymerase beta protein [uncultured bacterium]|nr:MAG: DNA polymerase beta protein [uncultured bacterium]